MSPAEQAPQLHRIIISSLTLFSCDQVLMYEARPAITGTVGSRSSKLDPTNHWKSQTAGE